MKTAGKVCVLLGVLFMLGAVSWWVFAVDALVKIPEDLDSTVNYEGEYTYYIDPLTYEPLAAGEEKTFPMQVRLRMLSEDAQYDSDTAIISGSLEMVVGGMELEPATGIIVDSYKTEEKISVKPDLTALSGLSAILAKYIFDPVLGPELEKLASMASASEDYEGQKLVEYEYAQTAESREKGIEDAREGKAAIRLAKTVIPSGILLAGAVLAAVGMLLFFRRSRAGGVEEEG